MAYTTIEVRGAKVTLDIRQELEKYDWGYNARWTEDKLIAQSPFRDDRSPSFYVNHDGKYAGRWGDSGAIDARTSNGKLPSLIAHMRGITHQEACEYLIDTYGRVDGIVRKEDINLPKISLGKAVRTEVSLSDYEVQPREYLTGRGITDPTQRLYDVGRRTDVEDFVGLPWKCEVTGEIKAIKYRSETGKEMFYGSGGKPVNELVFGLYEAKPDDYVVITEGEIDALSFREAGLNAIAVGTNSISNTQINKIKYQGFKTIYLGGDTDDGGAKLNVQVYREFKNHSTCKLLDYGKGKDANDVLVEEGTQGLTRVLINSVLIEPNLLTK